MLNKYDLKYKNFLKLERQYDEVSNKLYKLPMVKLEKPYQRGWFIVYDLREDIKRRKDAKIILEAINTGLSFIHTRNVADVRAVRAGKKSVRGKRGQTRSLEPGRIKLSEDKYKKLSKEVAQYFELDMFSDAYKKYKHKLYYLNMPRYWTVLKVKPNLITHVPAKGGILESEYTKLRAKLSVFWDEKHGYSKSFPRIKDRAQVRSAIQKFKHGESEDVEIKKVPLDYKY